MRHKSGTLTVLAVAAATAALFGLGGYASAQGFKRTMLQTTVFPGSNYVTALYVVDIDAGAAVPRHTHPGLETIYILDGEMDLVVEGQPDRHLKAGDSAQIPANTVHSAAQTAKPIKVLATYVVEKDKPLATIVPPKSIVDSAGNVSTVVPGK
jgi:quercetin dioxygenase-like cupin family protein